jgi:hypothetical protein
MSPAPAQQIFRGGPSAVGAARHDSVIFIDHQLVTVTQFFQSMVKQMRGLLFLRKLIRMNVPVGC